MNTLKTSPANPLTDVQVRIHATQANWHRTFNYPFAHLFSYVDKERKAPKDRDGRPAYLKTQHLPLVSFINSKGTEELVFQDEASLPKEPTEITNQDGSELVANLIA
jgi:hypothetical protein